MTQTITVKLLREYSACEEQVNKFINIFGEDAEVIPTMELAEKYGSEFNINWLVDKLLNFDQLKVYKEATAPVLKTYVEAIAPAQKIYIEAIAPAQKIYDEATDLVLKAYDEATDLVLKTYVEAMAPARKTYNEATDLVLKTYAEAMAPAQKTYNEASAIAFVKAWNT
jgi:hypothetical protein